MSNKIFKNYQINLGVPFQVKIPYERLYGENYRFNENNKFNRLAKAAGAGEQAGLFNTDVALPGIDGETIKNELGFDGGTAVAEAEKAFGEAERIVMDARGEGAEILAEAYAEASRIINASKDEAGKYYEQVCGQAAAEAAELCEQAALRGELEGREEGRAAYDALISEAYQLRAEAEEYYKKLMAGAEGDAVDLVMAIARKVIVEEISYNRKSLINLVKDAFRNCSIKENAVLKVSAEDYEYVLQNHEQILSMTGGIDNLDIKRDLSLGRGACVIETPFGNLDAGVSTRLKKIEDAFYSLLSANGHSDDELIA